MTTLPNRRWCALAVLLCSVCLCLAQPPSGLVTFSFDNTQAPVWDLSGNLSIEHEMQGTAGEGIPIGFGILSITNDARGKLSSSGFTILQVGDDFVAAEYRMTGKISGGGNSVNRVSFNVQLTGEDVIAGVVTRFEVSIKYNLEVDAEQLLLVGTAKGSAKFSGLSSARIVSDVEIALEPNMDGSWTLNMNIIPLNKLAGSATIVLSNGRVLNTDLSGSFKQNSGVTRLKMRGVGEANGTSIDLRLLTTEEEGTVVESLKGQILGQKVQQ